MALIKIKNQLPQAAAQLKSWGRLAQRSLYVVMLLSFCDVLCLCAFYALLSYALAPLVIYQDLSQISLLSWAFVPLFLRFVLRLWMAQVGARLSCQIEGAVREELMHCLLKVGPLSSAIRGSLSTLLVDAFDDIMPYFTTFMLSLRQAMVVPAVILIAVALMSPWSAFALFIMAPLIPFFMLMIGKGTERVNQRQWVQITRLAVRFTEVLNKLSFIRLFNLERSEIKRIHLLTSRWRVETLQVLRIAFLSALCLEFFATCGIAFCAITLGFAVYEHGFDYTKALFVLLCVPEFFLPLRQMGAAYHSRMRALGAMSSLMDLLHEKQILDLPPELQPQQEQRVASPLPDWCHAPFSFELRDVTVAYPDGRIGLRHFSCRLPANEMTALIGPSGSGKSTILQTLVGFTTVVEGEVIVNGHVCSHEDLTKLMPLVVFVPQSPSLFYGSLRDNLRIGRPDASDAELEQALALVGASDLITRFPDGLDHLTGDANRGISGGEVRLISLARAFLRHTPVVLLDEPTASLDAASEQRFLTALAAIAPARTVIVSAHRKDLIAAAHTIIQVAK